MTTVPDVLGPLLFSLFVFAFIVAIWSHWRGALRVQRGFELWCERRGLRHVAGQVSVLHPRATGAGDSAARDAMELVHDARSTLECQVEGSIWPSGPIGHVSVVRVRNQARGSGTAYVVVDVPVDAHLLARAGDAPERVAAPRVETRHETAKAIVTELTGASFADEVGAVLHRGRYVAWLPTSFGFFHPARATAHELGLVRILGASDGAVEALDRDLASIGTAYRELVESVQSPHGVRAAS